MSRLRFDISISLDGFVAGPNPSSQEPLGEGGEQLHEWAVATATFRGSHGGDGGEGGVDDDQMATRTDGVGATVMGRRMFSGGHGPWEDDPNADGWWGDDPPFHQPVFILTHHEREPVAKEGGTTFTFVTDGIESALAQAREAAGGLDVSIGGGAEAGLQYLRAGLLDELTLHMVPVLLGGGTRLFERDPAGGAAPRLERTSTVESPTGVVHLTYRVVN